MGVFDRLRRIFRRPSNRPRARKYSAAGTSRLAADWISAPVSADRDIRAGLNTLRARSREAAQNNTYVRGFLRDVRTNVVGPGIKLRAMPMDAPGTPGNQNGDRPTLDRQAKRAIEKAWNEWSARRSLPDVTGRLSWPQILAKAIDNIARDGECLIQILAGTRDNRFRYSLKFLDPGALDVEYNHTLRNGNSIRMGVEHNPDGRPVAYHLVQDFDSVESYYYPGLGKRYVRVPASQIIHEFLPVEGILQTRGVPWVVAALLRFNMLGGYEEAELIAARGAASKMGFIIEGEGDEDGYSGDSDPDVVDQGTASEDYVAEVEPGIIEKLSAGSKFEAYDPTHPTTAYKDFVKTVLRGIAAGLGTTYNALASDLEGVNYSSLREGKLREADMWIALQEFLIDGLVWRVYDGWLSTALTAGAIVLDNGAPLQFSRIEKYREVEWQGRRWAWVDPQKEGQALQTKVGMNFESVSEAIRASGRDPDAVYQQIAEDQETWRELGIVPGVAMSTLGQQVDAAIGGAEEVESDE